MFLTGSVNSRNRFEFAGCKFTARNEKRELVCSLGYLVKLSTYTFTTRYRHKVRNHPSARKCMLKKVFKFSDILFDRKVLSWIGAIPVLAGNSYNRNTFLNSNAT